MVKPFNPETLALPPELEGRQWLSFAEFGALAGVGPEAVRKWARRGCVRVTVFTPRCRMIPVSEVDRLKSGQLFQENVTGREAL